MEKWGTLDPDYAPQHQISNIVNYKNSDKKGTARNLVTRSYRKEAWTCGGELCWVWNEEDVGSLALSSARANTLWRSKVGIVAVNLVLPEEEPKKGEGSTVHRPCRGSLELRKFWNMDKCVPIENVAIRATQPNGCSSSQNEITRQQSEGWSMEFHEYQK